MVKLRQNIANYREFKHFTVEYSSDASSTVISMLMKVPVLTTENIPGIVGLLRNYYPGVLKTRCFNDLGLPFASEVVRTEIGHLFEHILIEHICKAKSRSGMSQVCVNGRTDWDWKKNPPGLFRITIDVGRPDSAMIEKSIRAAVEMTGFILNRNSVN